MKRWFSFTSLTCALMAGAPAASHAQQPVGQDAIRISKPGEQIGHFGAAVSVAAAGDYILMGAPKLGTPHDSGGVYLFENGSTTPTMQLAMTHGFGYEYQNFSVNTQGQLSPTTKVNCSFSYGQVDDAGFGTEVAISEEWVAMVAPNLGQGGGSVAPANCAGSTGRVPTVLLFKKDTNEWSDLPYETSPYLPTNNSYPIYGGATAINSPLREDIRNIAVTDTDLVIVAGKGAHVYSFNGLLNEWEYSTTLLPNVTLGDDSYEGLAIKGNRMVLGSPNENKIYVFHKLNGSWLQHAESSVDLSNLERGQALDFDGDFIVVAGSYYVDVLKFDPNVSPATFTLVDWVANSTGHQPTAHIAVTPEDYVVTYTIPIGGVSLSNEAKRSTYRLARGGTFQNVLIEDSSFGLAERNEVVEGKSLAVSGNTVIIGAPNCLETTQYTYEAGCILFDKYTNPFEQQVIIDDAEGNRLWVNGGSRNWSRGGDSYNHYYYVGPKIFHTETQDLAILRSQRINHEIYPELKFDIFVNGDPTGKLFIDYVDSAFPPFNFNDPANIPAGAFKNIVVIEESTLGTTTDGYTCNPTGSGWHSCTVPLTPSNFNVDRPYIQFRYQPGNESYDVRLDYIMLY